MPPGQVVFRSREGLLSWPREGSTEERDAESKTSLGEARGRFRLDY